MLRRYFEPKKKQLLMLTALLVCVVIFMVFLYEGTHRKGENPFRSEYVRAGGDTLNVAIELNPSVYSVQGENVSGRDYEILQKISDQCGVPIKYYPFVPLKRALDGLQAGEFDVVVASLPLITRLREDYLMTDPVYLDHQILVQRIDSLQAPIKAQVDLGGDTVWITADSPFVNRLANLSAEIGDTIYIESSPEYSAEALFILVAKGIIKYAVINGGIAQAMQPKYPDVDISVPISFTQFQSWALNPKDSVLCDSINHWLQIIK